MDPQMTSARHPVPGEARTQYYHGSNGWGQDFWGDDTPGPPRTIEPNPHHTQGMSLEEFLRAEVLFISEKIQRLS